MDNFFLFFCVIFVVFCESSAESSCDPWPSYLRSREDCCNIPSQSNTILQDICTTKCSLKSVESQSDCAVECYVNITTIIKDGSINKIAVKRLYENNAFHNREWVKVIGEAVEKCDYETTGTLTQNLIKFHNCVNDLLAENCVSFIQTPECDPTEEYHEQCKNIQPNCTAWPTHQIHPEVCCKTPQLFSEALTSKCSRDCKRKELFLVKQSECIQNCTYIETGLRSDGKVDFEVVKKMLIESSNKSEAWEKPIESSIQFCEKKIRGNSKAKKKDV